MEWLNEWTLPCKACWLSMYLIINTTGMSTRPRWWWPLVPVYMHPCSTLHFIFCLAIRYNCQLMLCLVVWAVIPSGCILKHPCTFCADLLVNADHQPAPRRRVPLVFYFPSCEWDVQAHRSWPLMSKASMPSISQRSSKVVFGILPFQEMAQIFRRHLRWNWSSFFTWRQY